MNFNFKTMDTAGKVFYILAAAAAGAVVWDLMFG